MLKTLSALAACAVLLAASLDAGSASPDGCGDFLWPLETEIAWFDADTSEKSASGVSLAALPSDKAITLALEPMPEVKLAAKPTSTPKTDDDKKFGGFVIIEKFPAPGHYQVAISGSGWLDVVQNGATLESTAHTGSPKCDRLRKSVRFEIGEGPVSIQVSGSPSDSIKIAVRPATD